MRAAWGKVMVSVTARKRMFGIALCGATAGLMFCALTANAQSTGPVAAGDPAAALTLMAPAPVADPARVAAILATPTPASYASLAAATVVAAPINPDSQAEGPNVQLYLKLMEINGTTNNVRMILKNAKDSIRTVVIERAGTLSLTPEQELRYDQAASDILKQTEADLILDIARTQSKAFTEAEISELLRANSSPAAQKYNAAKYVAPNEAVGQIQSYMVDAVYKILKTYKQAVAS
jgi:hypothetical protein